MQSSTKRQTQGLMGLAISLSLIAAPVLAKSKQTTAPQSPKAQTIDSLKADLASRKSTSLSLTKDAITTIKAKDKSLRAVISLNPNALKDAQKSDAQRLYVKPQPLLMGIPVLIKDNIETLDPMATTAGSLALKDNVTGRDAPVVARLRAAGAIILGKTNLSEWANIRSNRSMSGWSAVGGLVKNPHDLTRTACGSSSGSGAAVAAGYVVAAVGTETDGSVVCPASINGIVGLKPTLGLVSRTHVIPISHSQDTPGPMARTVMDTAIVMTAMAGSDPLDAATVEADAHKTDYAKDLSADALKGVRIGVMRDRIGRQPKTTALFNQAIERLKRAGAVIIDINDTQEKDLGSGELLVLLTELKADLNAYLATTPKAVKTRTLADVIAFNNANRSSEMPFFDQELFIEAQATKGLNDPDYIKARDVTKSQASKLLDRLMKDNQVDALVAPTYGPAWLSDPVNGDQYDGPSASELPATSGYPHLSVPMGKIQGLPVGLSFIAGPWQEAKLLRFGYAFEQTP